MNIRKIIALTCVLGTVFSFTACKNDSEGGKPEETDFVEFTGVVTTEIPEEDKGLSIEEIAKDITLNGKKITFPCKLGELGEGYGFSFFNPQSFTMLNEKKVFNAELSYNDEPNLLIAFMNEGEEVNPEEGQIYYISVLPGASADALKICGIGMGTPKADVEAILGKLYTVTDHTGKAVSYEYGDYQSIDISYDENDCVMDYAIKYVTF